MNKLFAIGLVLLGSVGGLALKPAFASAAAPQPPLFPLGRFLVVNPTPDLARNVMLLDSATGTTWVGCGKAGEISAWCPMTRGSSVDRGD